MEKKLFSILKEEYVKLKDTFTAANIGARKIVRLDKNSGMTYNMLTTQHCEGFSLCDTRGLNDYNAPHSPASRDLVRVYGDACNEEGIVTW
ncbi:MAG TPA: hypothetical protein DCY35_04125 [Prolixibacteraceae bacterium]|nr:hypothetical protein [Prolixibacteraceae bacterium]